MVKRGNTALNGWMSGETWQHSIECLDVVKRGNTALNVWVNTETWQHSIEFLDEW
jgi:hypothetical protein